MIAVMTTRLGQTPEITKALRKLDRNRRIRFWQRVDAFSGYSPKFMPVKKCYTFDGPEITATPIATTPVSVVLDRAMHCQSSAPASETEKMGAKYREVCARLEGAKKESK